MAQQANQKSAIVQTFILGGFTVTLPKPVPVLFEAHNGDVPWFEWDKNATVARVTTRKRVTKP